MDRVNRNGVRKMAGSLELSDQLKTFYEAHRDELYLYALSFTGDEGAAEDAVHDAFQGVLCRGKRVRELRPYLFRCVRNAAVDQLRIAARRNGGVSIFAEIDPDADTGEAALRNEIDELLSSLGEDERECIVLKIYTGLTFREIAKVRRVSLNTAASWYRRGLDKLRGQIEESG